jgi:hypothetical protein
MSQSNSQIQVGDAVYGNDDDQVGTVASVLPSAFVVEHDFSPRDYAIPFSAIAQTGNGEIVLNVSKDGLLRSGWDIVPAETAVDGREPETFSTDVMDTSDVEGVLEA